MIGVRERERERERRVSEGRKRSRLPPIDQRLSLNSIYTRAHRASLLHIALIARSRSSRTNFMGMSQPSSRSPPQVSVSPVQSRNISLWKLSPPANSAGTIHFCQSAIGMRKKKRARQKRATRSISLSLSLSRRDFLPLPSPGRLPASLIIQRI